MEKCSKKVICNLEIIVLNEKIWKVCWMIWGVKKSQWRPGKRGKILVWLNCKGQNLTVNKLIATHTFFMCFFLYMFLSLLCVLLAFFPVNLPLPCLAVPCLPFPLSANHRAYRWHVLTPLLGWVPSLTEKQKTQKQKPRAIEKERRYGKGQEIEGEYIYIYFFIIIIIF